MLDKKQVSAFLKVVSNDKMREGLRFIKIDRYNDKPCIVGTDGYYLAIVYIDGINEELIGKQLHRDYIERWYKLAKTSGKLGANDLYELYGLQSADDVKYSDYVNYKSIIPTEYNRAPNSLITFNATFMSNIQTLDGGAPIEWSIGSYAQPLLADTKNGYYMIMPVVRKAC